MGPMYVMSFKKKKKKGGARLHAQAVAGRGDDAGGRNLGYYYPVGGYVSACGALASCSILYLSLSHASQRDEELAGAYHQVL